MLLAAVTIDLGGQAVSQNLPFATQLTSPENGFGVFISGILSGVLVIAALMALLFLIWGGIEWISSGGDKGKIEKAREKITQSIVGLIVLAATVAIFGLVQNFLGVTILNFGGSVGGGPGSSNNNGSSNTSGSSTTTGTCAGGVAIGKTVSDGGAGGYCTNNASATVICHGANENLPYVHFDPVSCPPGSAHAWNWKTGS